MKKLLSLLAGSALLLSSGCGSDDAEDVAFDVEVSFSVSESIITEGESTTYLVEFSAPNTSGDDITFDYTVSGSATNGSDYIALSGEAVVEEGESSSTITLETIDDESIEDSETVTIALTNPQINGVTIINSSAEVRINDNDFRVVSISTNDRDANENGDKASFIISIGEPLDDDIEISYVVTGTAEAGADYEALAGSVTIPSGSSDATVEVVPIDDDLLEGLNSIVVSLSGNLPDGVTAGNSTSVTLNLIDDDSRTVSLSSSDNLALEGDNNASFTIAIDAALSESVDINYTLSGQAANGNDYNSLPGVATIPANETSVTVPVEVMDDEVIEGDETLVILLEDANMPTGISVGTGSLTLTIEDNDGTSFTAEVSITSSNDSATEGSDDATFTITFDRVNSSGETISIPYTISGTATAGSDYVALAGTAEIAASEQSVTIDVTLIDDTQMESDEIIVITLDETGFADGISLGSPASVTINVLDDNDFETSVSIVSTVDAEEPSIGGSFTVELGMTNTSGTAISIPYTISGTATPGTDYTALSGTVEIANESSSAQVIISVIDDTIEEGDETIIVNIDESSLPSGISLGTLTSATILIVDDNDFETTVSIEGTTSAAEPATNGLFTISLAKTNTTGATISIPYSISSSSTAEEGVDFDVLSGTVDIPNGSSSATVTINIIDDSDIEVDEELILTLNTENLPVGITAGSPTEASIAITNDDTASTDYVVTIQGKSVALEGDDQARFKLVLNTPNATGSDMIFEYTVAGTATEGTDYETLSGTVVIAHGETEVADFVYPIDDMDVEDDETIIITISETNLPADVTIGSPESKTIIIEDNDTNEPISITFGNTYDNSIEIDSWTSVSGVDGYIVAVSNSDADFTDYSSSDDILASTTYYGDGAQIVYVGSSISPLEVTLLEGSSTYYFKVYTYTGTTYDNSQTPESATTSTCTVSETYENLVCWSNDGTYRYVESNQYPDHDFGNFPNADVTPISISQQMTMSPTETGSALYIYDETDGPYPSNPNEYYRFGMASNGLGYNPMGLKPWENPNTGEDNWAWQAVVLTGVNESLNLDSHEAHVTSEGKYHYHGDPVGLVSEDGTRHSVIYGFAADGFPIYYKYGFSNPNDPTSSIVELLSSYSLKSGARPGDGVTAPDGDYDGYYIQDYEYIDQSNDLYLDECNGRYGITPEYPFGTYYYVITTDFPKIPNCFMGTPDDGFKIGN